MSHKDTKSPIPSKERHHTPKGETLREKAFKKTHSEDANPSQLGDPISLKAETSDYIPPEEEEVSTTGRDPSTGIRGLGGWTKGTGDVLKEAAATMFQGQGADSKKPGYGGIPGGGKGSLSKKSKL